MVSIIKNQLLKHLSRFTKNLSADKINLSTFKGEGELSNLELDEIVLTDLLELPSWMRLNHAWCNQVTFRIQWTRLKSVPIILNLDEVNIEVETCSQLRSTSAQGGLSSYMGSPGKYSYINKIIDGITVVVNTVNVTFKSPAFVASVQMSRITVESVSPGWKRSDLRMTRLKDPEKGQLLIFKELVWQTVRIEARSTKDSDLTPLRLLTNQARCRITIKKRISDCLVLGSRLVLILDDLLWVLTDSQLKAALHFLDSLAGLVQKATEVTRKTKAARKLEVLPEYQAQLSQQARAKENQQTSTLSKIFSRYDVIETSYHFLSQRIDLHLSDDPGDGRSCHPNLCKGGALQIMLQDFQVDYYPYHLAIGDRKHWAKYRETNSPHTQWLNQSFSAFRNKFMDLIDAGRPQHTPLSRSPNLQQASSLNSSGEPLANIGSQQSQDGARRSPNTPSGNPIKNRVLAELSKLMTSCIVLRVQDFSLYKVTVAKNQAPKEFITGDREKYSLPEEMSAFHAEFTYYYYPGDSCYPLPPPKFYVQVNPIQINFDVDSCLWANSFALNLHRSLLASKTDVSQANLTYIDVKIEAIMPRIVFESTVDHSNQKDRPKSLNIQISRASITNVRSIDQASRADLAKCIDTCHLGSLFFGTEFPSLRSDYYVVTDKFLNHVTANDNVRPVPDNATCSSAEVMKHLSRELFWTEAKDVWCIQLEPVWGDFFGTKAVGVNKAIPFLDAFPLTLWVHVNTNVVKRKPVPVLEEPVTADVHCLAHITNLVSVQINHYQYLFLLRLAEEAAELANFLSLDTNRITKVEKGSSLVLGVVLPQVEVSLVMPSQCPGKESSGGDLESVIPDSSSIADDLLTSAGGTGHWHPYNLHADSTESRKVTSFATGGGGGGGGGGTPVSEMSSSYSIDFPPAHDTAVTQAATIVKQSNGNVKSSTPTFSNMSISKDINAGLSSMKKGLSNFMTSLDSALKPSMDDASETMSIRSDASSDSENFVVVLAESGLDDAAFRRPEGMTAVKASAVELAGEVFEDENTATTPSEHSFMSSYKRRDLVSMATFKLGKVEFIQQSYGLSSSIKVQVSNIKCEECGSIPWDEFQNKFSSRSRAWSEALVDGGCSPCVKLRLDHEIQNIDLKSIDLTDKVNLMKLFTDNLEVKVNDVALELSMSTVTGLTDLLEDEIIRPPIPIQIDLQNVTLDLNEDRPPNNITSPGPVPLNLCISELHITRDTTGVIRIDSTSTSTITSDVRPQSSEDLNRDLQALQITTKHLKTDNDELRRRLVVFERVSEENRKLRHNQEEVDSLRACLTDAQDRISKLLDEKTSLIERMRELQSQLSYHEHQGRGLSSKR